MSSDRSVSREQYDLLLEEAQVVERERVRLEEELARSAIDMARLETELNHAQKAAERAGEAVGAEARARQALSDEVAEMRAERAVAVARLETLTELQERVRSLEDANNQLAFALRDAGQGVRQTLLEQGGAKPAGPGRRIATGVGAVLVAGVLGVAVVQISGLRGEVSASEDRAAEARERDREARELLADELRRSREDSQRWLETLREEQAATWSSLDEAAEARAAAARADAEAREVAWRAERQALVENLERLGAELAGVQRNAAEASETSRRLERSLQEARDALIEAERRRALEAAVPEAESAPLVLPAQTSPRPPTPVPAGSEPPAESAAEGPTPVEGLGEAPIEPASGSQPPEESAPLEGVGTAVESGAPSEDGADPESPEPGGDEPGGAELGASEPEGSDPTPSAPGSADGSR